MQKKRVQQCNAKNREQCKHKEHQAPCNNKSRSAMLQCKTKQHCKNNSADATATQKERALWCDMAWCDGMQYRAKERSDATCLCKISFYCWGCMQNYFCQSSFIAHGTSAWYLSHINLEIDILCRLQYFFPSCQPGKQISPFLHSKKYIFFTNSM